MPLCRSITFDGEALLGIWQVTESLVELESLITLTDEDRKCYNAFRFEGRRREWLAVRCLIQQMVGRQLPIRYLASGKPVSDEFCISISHTKGYVGVTLSHVPTAIDLEYPSDRVVKLAHRFVSPQELHLVDEDNEIVSLLKIWSAKEVLFKFYDQSDIVFNRHLFVSEMPSSHSGIMRGGISKDGFEHQTNLYFDVTDDLILVYC